MCRQAQRVHNAILIALEIVKTIMERLLVSLPR